MDNNSRQGLVRAVDGIVETVDDYEALLKLAPVGRYVVAAYRWARNRRIATFISALDAGTKRLSREEQTRFNAYLESKPGLELLADYAEATMRSRSRVVTAALAVLYSDPDHFRFPSGFKASAVSALEGLDDNVVEAFLILAAERANLPTAPGAAYQVFALRDAVVANSQAMTRWSSQGLAWVSVIRELVQRGLLAPDSSAGMRLGDEDQSWCVYFAFSDASDLFAELLSTARSYLNINLTPA